VSGDQSAKKLNFPGVCAKRGTFSIQKKGHIISSTYRGFTKPDEIETVPTTGKTQFTLVRDQDSGSYMYGMFNGKGESELAVEVVGLDYMRVGKCRNFSVDSNVFLNTTSTNNDESDFD
jgi:hypothetical protein